MYPYDIIFSRNRIANQAIHTTMCCATTRSDWRNGSSIIWELVSDPWWYDFEECGFLQEGYSWVDWCKDKMIIGPPRQRSRREEAELDEDYLSHEDIIRHCRPWSRTWPHPDDHSWCKVREVPKWAKNEFITRVSNQKKFKEANIFAHTGIGHTNLNNKMLEFI